jgi:hypothetical protein
MLFSRRNASLAEGTLQRKRRLSFLSRPTQSYENTNEYRMGKAGLKGYPNFAKD